MRERSGCGVTPFTDWESLTALDGRDNPRIKSGDGQDALSVGVYVPLSLLFLVSAKAYFSYIKLYLQMLRDPNGQNDGATLSGVSSH
jgi:hypothetical protein